MTDTFSVRLRAAIDKRGIAVAELADTIGLKRQTIYQLLAGNADPAWSTVCKLASALKVRTDYFRG